MRIEIGSSHKSEKNNTGKEKGQRTSRLSYLLISKKYSTKELSRNVGEIMNKFKQTSLGEINSSR